MSASLKIVYCSLVAISSLTVATSESTQKDAVQHSVGGRFFNPLVVPARKPVYSVTQSSLASGHKGQHRYPHSFEALSIADVSLDDNEVSGNRDTHKNSMYTPVSSLHTRHKSAKRLHAAYEMKNELSKSSKNDRSSFDSNSLDVFGMAHSGGQIPIFQKHKIEKSGNSTPGSSLRSSSGNYDPVNRSLTMSETNLKTKHTHTNTDHIRQTRSKSHIQPTEFHVQEALVNLDSEDGQMENEEDGQIDPNEEFKNSKYYI